MRMFLGASVLSLLAAPAWGEVGTVTCDSARAVAIVYSLYTNPSGPTEFPLMTGELTKTGAVCLLKGQVLGMETNGFTVTFSLLPSISHAWQLTIHRSSYFGGQMGAQSSTSELEELDPAAGVEIDSESLGGRLVKKLTGSALEGTTVRIPLAQRHAYDRQQDGNWRYVPLRIDYWGDLRLRIGNPDTGVHTAGNSNLPSIMPMSGQSSISKLVQ
ncbi:hypothetical protein [Dongia sp.]|uniref:hypothetical protein n=1 Tax=Dongia sp. TaxID=1977262 RepID=UPI0035B4EE7D